MIACQVICSKQDAGCVEYLQWPCGRAFRRLGRGLAQFALMCGLAGTAAQGQVITVDTNTLRTVKEMVYRAWYHEQSIFGQANDNAFRQGYMNGGRVGSVLSPKGPGARAPAWASARA